MPRAEAARLSKFHAEALGEAIFTQENKVRGLTESITLLACRIEVKEREHAQYADAYRKIMESAEGNKLPADVMNRAAVLKDTMATLTSEIYQESQHLVGLRKQHYMESLKSETLNNIRNAYARVYDSKAATVLQITYGNDVREETFKQTSDLIRSINQQGSNIYEYSDTQLDALYSAVKGIREKISLYSSDYTESEKQLVDLINVNLQSIEQIKAIPRRERFEKGPRGAHSRAQQPPKPEKLTPEQRKLLVQQGKEAGEFANRWGKEEVEIQIAESLIRRIRIATNKNKITHITPEEEQAIQKYYDRYGRQAQQRLPEKPLIAVLNGDIKSKAKEKAKNTILENKIQKSVLEYINAVVNNKVDPSVNPVLAIMGNDIVQGEKPMEIGEDVVAEKNKRDSLMQVQREVDSVLLNLNRVNENVDDPIVRKAAELAQDFPEQVRDALEIGFVFAEGAEKRLLNSGVQLQLEEANDMLNEANLLNSVYNESEKAGDMASLLRDDANAIESALFDLNQLGNATVTTNTSKRVTELMDGYAYDFIRGSAGDNTYFTSSQFYSDFMKSVDPSLREKVELQLREVNKGIDAVNMDSSDNNVYVATSYLKAFIRILEQNTNMVKNSNLSFAQIEDKILDSSLNLSYIDHTASILSMNGLKKVPGRELNFNEAFGIHEAEVIRRLAMSAMYQQIKLWGNKRR
jgi:hypothetical protein